MCGGGGCRSSGYEHQDVKSDPVGSKFESTDRPNSGRYDRYRLVSKLLLDLSSTSTLFRAENEESFRVVVRGKIHRKSLDFRWIGELETLRDLSNFGRFENFRAPFFAKTIYY